MSSTKRVIAMALIAISVYVSVSSIYTVNEVEQVIITQFGKPVGVPVTEAGLKVKVPFIQEVNPIDKRVLEWDGSPSDMPTKDKLYISVDLFARWRIVDPLQYFLRLRDRVPLRDAILSSSEQELKMGALVPIQKGRKMVEKEIFTAAAEKVGVFGIELLDIRFKLINYYGSV